MRRFKRIIALPVKGMLFLAGLFTYVILMLLKPFVVIRFGCIPAGRIGHLAGNTELYLRRRILHKTDKKTIDIFVSDKPANEQLLRMIKRRISVTTNRAALWTYNAIRKSIGKSSNIWLDMWDLSGFIQTFNKIPPQLSFTEKEEKNGRALLKEMGVDKDSQFVCLYVRDKEYLEKTYSNNHSATGWSYHDYRNCNIKNYLPAAQYIASNGIYVIRMGYKVEERIEIGSSYIIDYANHFRSDFGDIYLSAKCKFFLTSDGGLNIVPFIFGVPLAYANCIPPGGFLGWREKDIFIPKKLWSRYKNKFLSFREIVSSGVHKYYRTNEFDTTGIDVVENTPLEILELTKETNARLDGTWVPSGEDEILQRRYREIILRTQKCYSYISRIGTEFLKQNKLLLD